MKSKETVDLKDCQIQEARRGHNMEVLIKNSTEITVLPKNISVSDMECEASTLSTVTLQELEGKCIHERVTVDVKVQKAMDAGFVTINIDDGEMLEVDVCHAAAIRSLHRSALCQDDVHGRFLGSTH